MNLAKALLPLRRMLPPYGRLSKVRRFANIQRGAIESIGREMREYRLNRIGFCSVTVSGNSISDDAHATAMSTWGEETVERFAHNRWIFLADNINDGNDLRLMAGLANRHRDTHFIFIPHEITPEGLRRIKYELEGRTLLYSECDDNTDFANVQVLVIDFLGALAYIYRYASCSYVGGGSQLLHSVTEATSNGVLMAFSPETSREVKSLQLTNVGLGCEVRNLAEIDAWFCTLKENDERLKKSRNDNERQ